MKKYLQNLSIQIWLVFWTVLVLAPFILIFLLRLRTRSPSKPEDDGRGESYRREEGLRASVVAC
ncbi:hypothetical protein, partial [Mameliella alba]|uniref:hypothetical protein n=1 Tax=Mameliella alba TaxID=561184 RepID=UPI001E445FEE